MSARLRSSLFAAFASLSLVALLTGCTAGPSPESNGEGTPSDAAASEQTAPNPPESDATEPVDAATWRDNARAAGVETAIGSGFDSECADLYPDSITEMLAEYVGLDVWTTEMTGMIETPSLTCKFTAKIDGWGRGSIELGSETNSSACAEITPGAEGIVADKPFEASASRGITVRGCSADNVMHHVSLLAWDDEPRFAYVEDSRFAEAVAALMITDQDAYLDEALALYERLV